MRVRLNPFDMVENKTTIQYVQNDTIQTIAAIYYYLEVNPLYFVYQQLPKKFLELEDFKLFLNQKFDMKSEKTLKRKESQQIYN